MPRQILCLKKSELFCFHLVLGCVNLSTSFQNQKPGFGKRFLTSRESPNTWKNERWLCFIFGTARFVESIVNVFSLDFENCFKTNAFIYIFSKSEEALFGVAPTITKRQLAIDIITDNQNAIGETFSVQNLKNYHTWSVFWRFGRFGSTLVWPPSYGLVDIYVKKKSENIYFVDEQNYYNEFCRRQSMTELKI